MVRRFDRDSADGIRTPEGREGPDRRRRLLRESGPTPYIAVVRETMGVIVGTTLNHRSWTGKPSPDGLSAGFCGR